MTREERERLINLINEKLALCELPEDEFKEYEIERFGMSSRSTYPSKLGIAEATLEIIKCQLEIDQKVEDCISREAVIKHLPSVTPKTRWIPCSEKMPDINIHVLAQFVMGGMAECYYAHNWWHIVGGFRISGDEVIAWMPLPEPYKESDTE